MDLCLGGNTVTLTDLILSSEPATKKTRHSLHTSRKLLPLQLIRRGPLICVILVGTHKIKIKPNVEHLLYDAYKNRGISITKHAPPSHRYLRQEADNRNSIKKTDCQYAALTVVVAAQQATS